MELLIPGLILVALMVWASTRIKRSAAQAFEAEHIDGDGFSLDKPEGFLQQVDNDSENVFQAYSKEFGRGTAEELRAATAAVIKSETGTQEDDATTSDVLVRDGHEYKVCKKTIASNSHTLTLRIEVLAEQFDDFARRIDEMLTSFAPK